MTYDLEILKELSLPLLEEMVPNSSLLANDMVRGDLFWVGFNNTLLGTHWQLGDLLADYKIKDTERYLRQLENLKAGYFAALAQYHCTGHSTPAIILLLERADPAFMEEVAFQKDMLVAATQAGRAAIRADLKLSDELAGEDISDEEIAGAFNTLHRDADRAELRRQLQQSDEEEQGMPEPRKKRRITLPLLFLRIAAAAAVGAVATLGVVSVYNNEDKPQSTAVQQGGTDANIPAAYPASTDSTAKADSLQPGADVKANNADTGKINAAPPYIVLKGNAIDTATKMLVTDVTITMLDDKGKTQTVFSKDGKFRLRLPLHHDFVITGKKEGYHSARLSLSTMDAREADGGEVIDVVLRFSKDP